jgi:uncharacterized membrane-anchored protein
MNPAIIIVPAVLFVLGLAAYFLGGAGFFTLLLMLILGAGFIFVMYIAYWYLFVKKED